MKREKHRAKHELPNLEGKDDGIDGKREELPRLFHNSAPSSRGAADAGAGAPTADAIDIFGRGPHGSEFVHTHALGDGEGSTVLNVH